MNSEKSGIAEAIGKTRARTNNLIWAEGHNSVLDHATQIM
jgi:hypothetical protein